MNESHNLDTAEFPAIEDRLARHFGHSPPAVRVEFGALSHQGKVRENNEDNFLVIERRRSRCVRLTSLPKDMLKSADDIAYVLFVADGMGGAAFGEVASMMALRSGWEQSGNAIKWAWIINDQEIDELRQRVDIVFQRMNQTLLSAARAHPEYRGMGTTLTAAYTVGPEAFIGHIGDSRAYLFHAGKLIQLTRDQTVAQEALDLGLPVLNRSWHHKLTHCLGGPEQEVQVAFHHLRLSDGDQLLLCSDGLSDMVPNQEIARILGRGAPPQEAAQALVDLALERGGRDNVTVVLARYAL